MFTRLQSTMRSLWPRPHPRPRGRLDFPMDFTEIRAMTQCTLHRVRIFLDLWHRVKKNSWRSYVLVLTIFFLKVFFREINFLTFLGGSTDSSNHQVKPISQRRHSETKWISGPSSHVSQSKLWMCYDWVGTLLWKKVKVRQIFISRIYKKQNAVLKPNCTRHNFLKFKLCRLFWTNLKHCEPFEFHESFMKEHSKWNQIIVNFNIHRFYCRIVPIFLIKIDDSAKHAHKVICWIL